MHVMETAERVNLLGLDGAALSDLIGQWGGKPFRARQLQRWMHQRGADSFDTMTDLARDFRSQLAQHCSIQALPVNTEQLSSDGPRQWLFVVGQGSSEERRVGEGGVRTGRLWWSQFTSKKKKQK